ncbi:Ribulose bisphosphate carboxylase large chain [Didymella glomerata]|uniref:Ribulose bisphosphate carboxylase large chain n=1 Tax=Didymella glomerata TaxID=749621 RepID=A0A9W8WQX3_9PLEO|nr:Ribulose bisphosphate carboxylase large chain [Didymella glomerata]
MVSPDAFAGMEGYFYLVIAGFCLFSAGLAHFYYVETAGHSLEEIAIAFGDKAFADGDDEVLETVTAGAEKHERSVNKDDLKDVLGPRGCSH